MSLGPSCVSTKRAIGSRTRHARAAAHVIVVQKNREQPDIVAGGFSLFVVVGADFLRRLLQRVGRAAIELHQLERLDLLRLAVFGHVEVARLQVGDRVAVLVRNDYVDTDEVDAGLEGGRLLRLIGVGGGGGGWLLLLRRRLRLWRLPGVATRSERDDGDAHGCGDAAKHAHHTLLS